MSYKLSHLKSWNNKGRLRENYTDMYPQVWVLRIKRKKEKKKKTERPMKHDNKDL